MISFAFKPLMTNGILDPFLSFTFRVDSYRDVNFISEVMMINNNDGSIITFSFSTLLYYTASIFF